MAIDTSLLKLNTIVKDDILKSDSELKAPTTSDTWLLSLTSRYNNNGLMNVERVMSVEDVISGDVEKEINKIISEEDQIAKVIKENTNTLNSLSTTGIQASLRSISAKTIGFVNYTQGHTVNAKTNTTSIKNSIISNNSDEQKLISGAIDVMVDWLDDYIANYNVRVAEGLRQNDSELKLSFLLEIRKAIENCDFPVGFGTVGNSSSDDFTPEDLTMGAYYPGMQSYTDGSLVGYDTYHLNGPSRNILLNPTYFMPERPYNSLQKLQEAIEAEELDHLGSDNLTSILVDDDAYNSYCKVNLAITLWHELIHSTHIYNEYVTYFATDAFEDDFKNKQIEGYTDRTKEYLAQLVPTLFSDGITYYDLGVTHYFDNYNDVVDFAWKAMQQNQEAFDIYMPGVTKAEFEKELQNFIANA